MSRLGWPPLQSISGVYGGIEMAACENEILKAMASGMAKNSSIHRYGTAITPQRGPGIRLRRLLSSPPALSCQLSQTGSFQVKSSDAQRFRLTKLHSTLVPHGRRTWYTECEPK